MDVVIAVSFHSAVFSLSMNVPTLGLYEGEYYRMKIGGIFNLIGMDNLALNASKEHVSEIVSKFKDLVARKDEIRKLLTKINNVLQKECCYACRKLIKTLK